MSSKVSRKLAARVKKARRDRNHAEKMHKRAVAHLRKALRAYRRAA